MCERHTHSSFLLVQSSVTCDLFLLGTPTHHPLLFTWCSVMMRKEQNVSNQMRRGSSPLIPEERHQTFFRFFLEDDQSDPPSHPMITFRIHSFDFPLIPLGYRIKRRQSWCLKFSSCWVSSSWETEVNTTYGQVFSHPVIIVLHDDDYHEGGRCHHTLGLLKQLFVSLRVVDRSWGPSAAAELSWRWC